MNRLCLVICFITACLIAPTFSIAQELDAIPDDDSLTSVEKQVDDLFGEQIEKATTSSAKAAVVDLLLKTAAESNSKPADYFVLLRRAQEISVADGNVSLAMQCVDLFTSRFKSDPLKVRGAVLTKLAKSAKSKKQQRLLVTQCEQPAVLAMNTDKPQLANRFLELGIGAAKQCRDLKAFERLDKRRSGLKLTMKQKDDFEQAMTKLEEDPENVQMNLLAGKYLCFVKGQWQDGMMRMAKSNETWLAQVVELELKTAADQRRRVAVGDAWWSAATTNKENEFVYQGCLMRAGSWYKSAAEKESLTGLTKLKVQQRLKDIGAVGTIPALVEVEPQQTPMPIQTEPIRGFEFVQKNSSLASVKIPALQFAPDSKHVIVSNKEKLHKLEIPSLKVTAVSTAFAPISAIRFSPEGDKIYTTGTEGDSSFSFFDADSLKRVQSKGVAVKWLKGLAVSRDGKYAVVGGDGGMVTQFDLSTLTMKRTWATPNSWMFGAVFTPNNELVVTCGAHGVQIYDLATGKIRHNLKNHNGRVWSVAMTPDGKKFATSGADKKLMVWDTATGKRLLTLQRHTLWPRQIDITPDGSVLVSAGLDKRICLWDLETGKLIHELTNAQSNGIESVACSPGGEYFATGDTKGKVVLWRFER